MDIDKYSDRYEAGKILVEHLKEYANNPAVIVLALPRGGVPVAYEIAKALAVPLDVFIVRKLGVPGQEELAMGALAMQGTIVFNDEIVQGLNIQKAAIDRVIQAEQQELQRRIAAYRGNRPFPDLTDKIIILVDDGIATGATMRAAITALQQQKPAQIVVAVPVAAITSCEEIAMLAVKIVCPLTPQPLYSVGAWYVDFTQTTDVEVRDLFAKMNS